MAYIPDAGQVVWLLVDPRAGHEQSGRRPALVVSPARYNAKAGLMVCCPLTMQIKGYPFEVPVSIGGQPSAVLSDQVKSLDWKVRKAKRTAEISPQVMAQVRAKIKALLQIL